MMTMETARAMVRTVHFLLMIGFDSVDILVSSSRLLAGSIDGPASLTVEFSDDDKI